VRVVLDGFLGKAIVEFDDPSGMLPPWRRREQGAFDDRVIRPVVAEVLRSRDRITEWAAKKIAGKLVGRATANSLTCDLEVVFRESTHEGGGPCLGCGVSLDDLRGRQANAGECPRPSLRSKRGYHVFDEVRKTSERTIAYRAASRP
jgi:hypothetical protein